MLDQVLVGSVVVLTAVSGWFTSNLLYDLGAPGTVSRRPAPVLGGLAFLIAVLWLDVWTAVALSTALTLLVLGLRPGYRRGLRGVGRSDATQDWAEMAYPVAATMSLAVGWGLFGDKWLGFLPIAFMSWGDTVAGLARAFLSWRRMEVGIWPTSLAMLCVCLMSAMFIQPYWIGALGAVAATGAERSRVVAQRLWADSWVPDDPFIVGVSLGVMGILIQATA